MTEYIFTVKGMACEMCENHVNDAVRKAFKVKKVTSSAAKKRTEIISDEPLDEAQLRAALAPTGYTLLSVAAEPYEKKGFRLFG